MNGICVYSMSVFLLLAGASLGVAANGNGSISGKVLDGTTSEPLRDVLVELGAKSGSKVPVPASTRTDMNGNYSFSGLSPILELGFGYTLFAKKDGYSGKATGLISLQEGESKVLDIALRRILSMAVRVVEAGAPDKVLAGASVSILYLGQEYPTSMASTDSSGRFRFGGMYAGDFGITVFKPGYRTRAYKKTLTGLTWEDSVTVALERDEPISSKSLHGQVATPSGMPASLRLFFTCETSGGPAWLYSLSGRDGAYVLGGIPGECQAGYVHIEGQERVQANLGSTDTRLDLIGESKGGPMSINGRAARQPVRGKVGGRDMLGRSGMERPRAGKRPSSRGYPPRIRLP